MQRFSRGMVFSKKNDELGRFWGQVIMNLVVKTMFGLESKFCTCGLEVRH